MANAVCEAMTNRIIDEMSKGNLPPWAREWKSGGINGPVRNAFSGTPYNGINVFLLNAAMLDNGYSDPRFATWKQIQEKGGKVKAGEEKQFYYINFWKTFDQKDKQGRIIRDTNGKAKQFPMLRAFRVYNVEQTEGLKLESFQDEDAAPFEPIDAARDLWEAWDNKPPVNHGGDLAAYYPGRDLITMPKPESFNNPEAYYSTLFHEGGHATGHDSRLARPGIATAAKFGSTTYAREELVAEMFAAMLCGITQIENKTIENHAAYLKSWITKLGQDPMAIMVAAGQAQKAVDYVLTYSSPRDGQEAQEEAGELVEA